MNDISTLRPKSANAVRSFLRKWRQTTWSDCALLCEAMVLLAISRIAIAVLPFRTVGWVAGRRCATHAPGEDARIAAVRRIRWAIRACAKRAPIRALCFQQALAAQIMLRRRGLPSTLYFGVAPEAQKGLIAHAWVRDGDVDVVGCENAAQFAVLATFPPVTHPPPDAA